MEFLLSQLEEAQDLFDQRKIEIDGVLSNLQDAKNDELLGIYD